MAAYMEEHGKAEVSKKELMFMLCSFIPSMVGFEIQRAQSHNGFTVPASAFPNFLGEKRACLSTNTKGYIIIPLWGQGKIP